MNHQKFAAMATGQTKINPEFEKAYAGYHALLNGFQSIQLATTGPDGTPEASYAPAIVDAQGNFYVYVSELAAHTANLLNNGKASVLVIEDESIAEVIFARKRVTFTCTAKHIERHNHEWESVIAEFEKKFGKMMGFLKTMEDFHLFRLEPGCARLVLGFGKAYDVVGDQLNSIEHVSGNGVAHRREKSGTENSEETVK